MLGLFIILLSVLKFIPLYTLIHTKHTIRDFLFGCVLFILYSSWLTYQGVHVPKLVQSFYFSDMYIKDNDITQSPSLSIIDSIINKI